MATRFFSTFDGYKITSPYGMRTIFGSVSMHKGVDLVAVPDGGGMVSDWIRAFDDGEVIAAGYNSVSGYYCRIRHDETAVTIYCHMLKGSMRVKAGDRVKRGDILGYMGSTGRSTGAHLHLGVELYGSYVDPEPYFEKNLSEVNNITLTHTRKVLRRGSYGEEVRLLQTLLNYHGANIATDSSFGPKTLEAVKSFQTKNGLDPDGSVGPLTWKELMK